MDAKTYLEQYQASKRKIQRLKWTIDELRSMASSTEIKLDGLPHGSGLSNPIEHFIVKTIEKETELQTEIERNQRLLLDIENTIEQVSTPELSDLLYMRYIKGMNWDGQMYYFNKTKSPYISDKIGKTRRQCYRLHEKALQEVQGIISRRAN